MTRQQVADELAISVTQVDRLCRDGEIEAIRLGRRMVRITASSVDELVDRCCNRSVREGDSPAETTWIDPADPLGRRRKRGQRGRTAHA